MSDFGSSKRRTACVILGLLLAMSSNLCWSQTGTLDALDNRARPNNDTTAHKPKSPSGALVRSLVVPGWGQWYNGKKLKAVIVFGVEAGLISTAVYWNRTATQARQKSDRLYFEDKRNLAVWYLVGTVVLSMLDAYVDAQLSDFDESPSLDAGPEAMRAAPQNGFAVRFQLRL